ncbi:glycosyltransferase family A protein [Tamlana sp. 2_MG-2023]|uniref:glycosyltransferase family 2 protein n=1 Tax=unclassified Tamlana TaxID=2614803 RepID=UPI0026E20EC3|nr:MULTISPECIES: glycosyltransferase family A protein [unclassified Tamlana]MDO6760189.1 glycosyltransferase family A protein [Tamlana sp. 2_MG-2023]MDO6790113.1 glycosyltransferase family A protein [Tamlana sp. 1_MG-2023]
MDPFISVVIPLYNKDEYIEATINSVLNQTYSGFEVIVVNDGSTDESLNVVQGFKNEKIKIYTNKNRGLSYSRNYGIKKAKANYIAFLDADDLWKEDFLETINQLILKKNEALIFATNFETLPPHKTPNLSAEKFNKTLIKEVSNFFMLEKNFFTPSSLVIHKSVFKNSGYFNEDVNYGEEYDFYIRCFSKYNLIHYQENKAYYRTDVPNQLTAPNKNFKRIIPDYCSYQIKINHPDLKHFLDFIHYELVVLFKMERNSEKVRLYKNLINTRNLTWKQKIKFHLPTSVFYYSKKIYISLSKIFIQS